MKFPTYWSKVKNSRGTITARGWSDQSPQQAETHAQQRLQRIQQALQAGRVRMLERYPYESDDVICEEVVQRIVEGEEEIAVISRNAYGALILNARTMMFVDLDFPVPARASWWARLLGRPAAVVADPLQAILQKVRQWSSEHPQWTWRLYRTCVGVRAIVVNERFEQVDAATASIMRELSCDELYVRLCQSQGCFRARLTPKPWRVGIANPPAKYPFETAEQRKALDVWSERLMTAAEQFAVCQYLETIGDGAIWKEHLKLIEIHDSYCCRAAALPLA